MRRSAAVVLAERAAGRRQLDLLETAIATPAPAPEPVIATPTTRKLVIAKCLVTQAKPTPELKTLLPYAGPEGVLLAQAWASQEGVNRQQIVSYAREDVCATVEKRKFDRVILWSDETDLDEERDYFLHGFELVKPGGKIVAAVSAELASDRSFRTWANKKSATFDEPGASFRSRGLVMVTLWKSA